MIISPVCSLEDVVQGVNITDGRISISSEYNRDVYDNALKNLHQEQHHMKILYFLYSVRTQDIIFDAVESQRNYRKNPFVLGDAYLTPF